MKRRSYELSSGLTGQRSKTYQRDLTKKYTHMMKQVSKVFRKDSLLFFLLSICLDGCNTKTKNSKGFALEEFAVDNPSLNSIIDSVAGWHSKLLSKNVALEDITNVILVSDINHIVDLRNLFSEFIHPTGNIMTFDFIRFPSDFYHGDTNSRWSKYDSVFDPSFIVYQYDGHKFLPPVITTNIDVWE